MTTPPPEGPHKPGVTATLAALGHQLVSILPPAFLLVIILNVLFLGVITWVADRNAETRNQLLTKIIERCLLAQRQ
jgi:hypothetical protein